MKPQHLYPCRQTRRELLWQMGCGFTGLALIDQLAKDGTLPAILSNAKAEDKRGLLQHEFQDAVDSSSRDNPQKAGIKSCIFFFIFRIVNQRRLQIRILHPTAPQGT